MKFVAVITARAGSRRLPGKNMLPLVGKPVAEWSLVQAKAAGLEMIVSTDIPELLELGRQYGAHVVSRPPSLAGEGSSHPEAIKHAVADAGMLDRHVVLLQPTSPFRQGEIINKCLLAAQTSPPSTVLTSHRIHCFVIAGPNEGERQIWDGCVAIYPPGKIGDYSDVVAVPNDHLNSLQIDHPDDFEQASILAASMRRVASPVADWELETCVNSLRKVSIQGDITLVARPDGAPIPQNLPVAWLNHCHGWDAGRADVLFIISNLNLRKVGLTRATREVAAKARLVIIRNNGQGEWLHANLPEMAGKNIEICCMKDPVGNHLTTGALASDILHRAGCRVVRVGFDNPSTRAAASIGEFNFSGVSHEIAILNHTGTNRQP